MDKIYKQESKTRNKKRSFSSLSSYLHLGFREDCHGGRPIFGAVRRLYHRFDSRRRLPPQAASKHSPSCDKLDLRITIPSMDFYDEEEEEEGDGGNNHKVRQEGAFSFAFVDDASFDNHYLPQDELEDFTVESLDVGDLTDHEDHALRPPVSVTVGRMDFVGDPNVISLDYEGCLSDDEMSLSQAGDAQCPLDAYHSYADDNDEEVTPHYYVTGPDEASI